MAKRKQIKIKGGNTNLFKTRVKPRRIIRGIKKRKRNTRGGGIFSFLAKGLSKIKNKLPSSLARVAQEAVRKGTYIAKRELQKPKVQKAIKSAIIDGSKVVATHIIQKASGKKSSSLRDSMINHLLSKREENSTRKPERRRKRKQRNKRVLFQTN